MSLNIKTCYSQDGRTAKLDYPCDPNAAVSACCGADSTCVDNFYCRDSGGNNIAGTCTDQQFGIQSDPTPGCPCRTYFKNDASTLNWQDSATSCPDGSVCCGSNNFACCNAGKGNPHIQYRNTKVIPSSTASLAAYYSGMSVTTLPVTRASMNSTSSVTTLPATRTSTSSTSSVVAIQTGAASVSFASSPASVSTSSSSTDATTNISGLSTQAKIGIGVGAGTVGLLLLFTLIFLIATWKRYTKLKRSTSQAASRTSNQTPSQPASQRAISWSPMTLGRYEAPVVESAMHKKPAISVASYNVGHPAEAKWKHLPEPNRFVRMSRRAELDAPGNFI